MATSSTVRQRLTPAQREHRLRAFRQSGLSQRVFAAQAGVALSTLQLWLRASRGKRTQTTEFLELPNLWASSAPAAPYRLCWTRGLTLEVGRGFVAEELAGLLP